VSASGPASDMGMLTGARVIAQGLEAAGVDVVFGLPGVHNLALWKELAASPIRLVGVRHEQAAAYAADGYARASGQLGVAATTTGPGAANTLGAVGEAWASRSPVLVIATDVSTEVRRPGVWRGSLHEASDQAAMFAPVTKAAVRVRRASEVGPALAQAVATALSPPCRPVYLEIPTNLLAAEAGNGAGPRAPQPPPTPNPEALDRAGAVLERSRSPLVWVGGGALQAGAGDQVRRLADRLVAPVISTYSARGLLPPGPPLLVGPPHVPPVGALWDEADVVVAIGSDLDAMTTQGWSMPQPPHLLCVNVDPLDAAKNYLPDLVLEGDAREVTEALAARVAQRPGREALAHRLDAVRREVRESLPSDALEFLDTFAAAVPADGVVLCDMCIPGYWLGAFHPVPAPRRLVYPMGWGTLGCAFPQALGAALAGSAPAVSVSGDGGFLYACGELATAKQERMPIAAVVVDDGGYGMLRFDQDRRGDPREGVDLETPDFEALAASFGVRAETVTGLGSDFGQALERHVMLDEPTLLVARAALDPPPNVSPRWYRRQPGAR
jgi:thiamine pyrophosphate-dependent acetolactate synthase large subunit-like protein